MTSVSRAFIAGQLSRLMGKAFPPVGEALAEVVSTIQRLAEDETHVQRIIETLLSVAGNFPEPAAFANAAEFTATQVLMADPTCSKCGGVGFTSKRVGEYYGSTKCNCWARRPKSTRPWAMSEGSYGA